MGKTKKEQQHELTIFRLILIIVDLLIAIAYILCKSKLITISEEWDSCIESLMINLFSAILCAILVDCFLKKIETNGNNRNKEKFNEFTNNLAENYKLIDNNLTKLNSKLTLLPSGIIEVCKEDVFNSNNGYNKLFNNSTTAICILNHGNRFYEKHHVAIYSRFDKKGFSTRCFFLEPKVDNDSIKVLSYRTNTTPEALASYINTNIQNLIDAYSSSSKEGSLEIFCMKSIPMQAIFVFDKHLIECKYYSSKEKGDFENIILHDRMNSNKNSISAGFVRDCKCIENESVCIYSSYVEQDNSFKKYLGKILSCINNTTFGENTSSEISIVNLVLSFNGSVHSLNIGYRYYKDENVRETNRSFCITQYTNSYQKSYNSTPFFFICGIDGNPENPSRIIIQMYNNSSREFIVKSDLKSGQKPKLRDFGYDRSSGQFR